MFISEEKKEDDEEVEGERKKLKELGVGSTWDLLSKKKEVDK